MVFGGEKEIRQLFLNLVPLITILKPPIPNEERKDMTYKFTTKGGEVISRLRARKLNIDGVWGRKGN